VRNGNDTTLEGTLPVKGDSISTGFPEFFAAKR
jgi:hypothetical protein